MKTVGADSHHQNNKRNPAIVENTTIIHSNAACGTCRINHFPPKIPTTTPGSKRAFSNKLSEVISANGFP